MSVPKFHCDEESDCRECELEFCTVSKSLYIKPGDKIIPMVYLHEETKKNYEVLLQTLIEAFNQAAYGKGKERHASNDSYDKQPCCSIARKVGIGFPLGQAMKKIEESIRLETEHGIAELLGAINYIAAAIIVLKEGANP
ncbi:MAG: hypothetical protein WC503_01120 [Candidatus Shapirobacteria bacterium]